MKDKIMIIVAGLQPLTWWGIYNIFQRTAKVHDSETGLLFACVFSCMIIIFAIIAPIIDKKMGI